MNVSVTEGTRPQSRSRLVESSTIRNVQRNSVKEYKPFSIEHKPYSSAFRPVVDDQPPTFSVDLGGLRKNLEAMITDRQKKRRRGSLVIAELTRNDRLLEALRRLEAMDGSPDLIVSIKKALEEVSE